MSFTTMGQGDVFEARTRADERRLVDPDWAAESEPDEVYWCRLCEGEPAQASAIIEHKTRGCIAVCPGCHAVASEADQISSAEPTVLL